MLTLRVDKWLRVGSGVGLLLLLVAQEKVCPWLLMPPPQSAQRWLAESAPAADGHKQSEKRTKPTLPCILPDAPAPRWPAGWSQTTIRQTTGARDGVLACGQKDRHDDNQGALPGVGGDPYAWQGFQLRTDMAEVQPLVRCYPSANPAVRTCIMRTGPPRA